MTNKKFDDGGPAFPGRDELVNMFGQTHPKFNSGMTLWDFYAAHAPIMPEQWFKDSPRKQSDPLWHWGEASAAWACFYADALLEERKKRFG